MAIVVAATIKALEGKGDALEQELRKLAPKVRQDKGALTYIIHRSAEDPLKFFVYEKYEGPDAIKFHVATPHFREFSAALNSLMDGRIDIQRYSELV
jgi:quinol monooxygenase YgiN